MPTIKLSWRVIVCLLLFASCSQNNVTEDQGLSKYFDEAGVSGSFGLFDNGQGKFTIYNLKGFRDSASLPAQTFDLVQSLVGLQTGVLRDEKVALPADSGTVTLKQAFQDGNVGVFVRVASTIGKDTMKKWIDTLGYGNKGLSGPIDSFWLNNRMKVTADEQLGLTKRLYFDQLPFYKNIQQRVRGMMQEGSNANYILRYKTGKGVDEKGHGIGWMMGWVEENKHPYFFVIKVETTDPSKDLASASMGILKGILTPMGFFQGKK